MNLEGIRALLPGYLDVYRYVDKTCCDVIKLTDLLAPLHDQLLVGFKVSVLSSCIEFANIRERMGILEEDLAERRDRLEDEVD